MKPISLLVFALLGLTSCTFFFQDAEVPAGTFVRHMKSDFSVANDTIVVAAQRDGWVRVTHKTTFQRINESGGFTDAQHKNNSFEASYDEAEKQFANPKTGAQYSFPEGSNTLVYNGASYKQVK
jgi:hypothetical protein